MRVAFLSIDVETNAKLFSDAVADAAAVDVDHVDTIGDRDLGSDAVAVVELGDAGSADHVNGAKDLLHHLTTDPRL